MGSGSVLLRKTIFCDLSGGPDSLSSLQIRPYTCFCSTCVSAFSSVHLCPLASFFVYCMFVFSVNPCQDVLLCSWVEPLVCPPSFPPPPPVNPKYSDGIFGYPIRPHSSAPMLNSNIINARRIPSIPGLRYNRFRDIVSHGVRGTIDLSTFLGYQEPQPPVKSGHSSI